MPDQALLLVVGSGSIARRHILNLKHLFSQATIACLSSSGKILDKQELGCDVIIPDMLAACTAKPDFAIIASPATYHLEHACALLDAEVPVLIEKPLAASSQEILKFWPLLEKNKDKIDIAYNLRYLSSTLMLKKLLDQGKVGRISSISVDVGQYLPDWRPQSDYRKTVSAQQALGGGVLLELSHDLDYLIDLFGPVQEVFCYAGNTGLLDLDVEDNVSALICFKGLVARVHLDFLQRYPHRSCKIVGSEGTLLWDVLNNTITFYAPDKTVNLVFSEETIDKNAMYQNQIHHFAQVAAGLKAPLVGIDQGFSVLRLIDALKRSSASKQAVSLRDYY